MYVAKLIHLYYKGFKMSLRSTFKYRCDCRLAKLYFVYATKSLLKWNSLRYISISSARHGTSFHTPVLEYPNVRKRMTKRLALVLCWQVQKASWQTHSSFSVRENYCLKQKTALTDNVWAQWQIGVTQGRSSRLPGFTSTHGHSAEC